MMNKKKYSWIFLLLLFLVIFITPLILFLPSQAKKHDPWFLIDQNRSHFDHASLFKNKFNRPQDVTLACLECHPDAAKGLMKTSHWKWEGKKVKIPGRDIEMRTGKKNLINNFCIGIQGNESTCVSCHAGYGWKDKNFDFKKEENVDCLICHDWSGTYAKGKSGLPVKGTNLLEVARSVGYPKRDNCGICHIYGGGGMGVKHGDLDNSLINPSEDIDVHMGKHNLLCIDCHRTEDHNITGVAYSVSVNHENGIQCTDCHQKVPHNDSRINLHIESLACQTCHIGYFAKRAPTKTHWDWSKAGDFNRKDDAHVYLRIKGEFIYAENIVPEYFWFDMTTNRYLLGDKVNPTKMTHLNYPRGDISDANSKIWPFKVHRAKQPYDKTYKYILQPVTSGEGGYWHDFNWDKALRLSEKETGLKYSGNYGFLETDMHWPLSHMVSGGNKALKCCDCHGGSRMNWEQLGYDRDPINTGGRKILQMLKKDRSDNK
jgi:octaheme c-type cytochrome (tetrathionate reductase family)